MTSAAFERRALSASEHSAQLRKAVIASTIGTTIEWYDFFIYGTKLRRVCRRSTSPVMNNLI
jgi:hypothetical protein